MNTPPDIHAWKVPFDLRVKQHSVSRWDRDDMWIDVPKGMWLVDHWANRTNGPERYEVMTDAQIDALRWKHKKSIVISESVVQSLEGTP